MCSKWNRNLLNLIYGFFKPSCKFKGSKSVFIDSFWDVVGPIDSNMHGSNVKPVSNSNQRALESVRIVVCY